MLNEIRKMSLNDFLALNGWKHRQELSVVSHRPIRGKGGKEHIEGAAKKISVYQDKFMVIYDEAFGYDQGNPDSFWSTTSLEYDGIWMIDGAVVVDPSGNAIHPDNVGELLPAIFREIDYQEIDI